MTDVRQAQALSRDECLGLLGSVSWGRVVFTHLALPAIRPASHLVDGDQVIVSVEQGTAAGSLAGIPGTVVAYEADLIDGGQLGWSVVVVGRARRLPDGEAATGYRAALLPEPAGLARELLAIRADMVEGFRPTGGPA